MKNTTAFCTIVALFTSCSSLHRSNSSNHTAVQSPVISDSAELTTLVRKVYKWHGNQFRRNGFPYKFASPGDSIFSGIDWSAYSKDMAVFQKTNFFSKDFFAQHRAIALSIDSSIKQAGIKWRNINDGIPLWDTNADEWCQCQDYPDNYWNFITLNKFTYDHEAVTFYWTWGNKNGAEANRYEMRAKKEDGTWKISYIGGFKDYSTADH